MLPPGQFLTYKALHRTFATLWSRQMDEPPTHSVLQLLLTWGKGSHLVKWLYKALADMIRKLLTNIKLKWEALLNRAMTDKEWSGALMYPQKISRNTRLKYIQFNYLHQTYLTPKRITAIYGGAQRTCPRCALAYADYCYMVWSCHIIMDFWQNVTQSVGGPFRLP